MWWFARTMYMYCRRWHWIRLLLIITIINYYVFITAAAEKMVVYMENGSIIAAGNLLTDHHSIHGHSIPPHHVCVLLTAAKEKYKAPLVLGDEDENFFWKRGSFLLFRENHYWWLDFQIMWFLLNLWKYNYMYYCHYICYIHDKITTFWLVKGSPIIFLNEMLINSKWKVFHFSNDLLYTTVSIKNLM